MIPYPIQISKKKSPSQVSGKWLRGIHYTQKGLPLNHIFRTALSFLNPALNILPELHISRQKI